MPVHTYIRDRIAQSVFDHPSDYMFGSVIWTACVPVPTPTSTSSSFGRRAAVFCGGAATYRPPKPIASALSRQLIARDQAGRETPDFCAVVPRKVPHCAVARKEGAQRLEPRDVYRSCRCEHVFTLDMYMHEDSQKPRDAFVAEGKAAKF